MSTFGLSTFWFVDVLVCRRFGLSTFRFVDVSVCRRFGLSTFRCVDVLVCRRFGLSTFRLSTFRFVDVLTSNRRDHFTLRWRHNGRDGVSNHQPHDCLLNRLFRRRSKKTSKLRVTGLCEGNSPGNYPHKWPVTRKIFPFHDVIMNIFWCVLYMIYELCDMKVYTDFLQEIIPKMTIMILIFNLYFDCDESRYKVIKLKQSRYEYNHQ